MKIVEHKYTRKSDCWCFFFFLKQFVEYAGNEKLNTWRGQQQNGSESIPMEAGKTHGPNVRGGGEILGQACQVESPFPGIPLVHNVLWVEDILITE